VVVFEFLISSECLILVRFLIFSLGSRVFSSEEVEICEYLKTLFDENQYLSKKIRSIHNNSK